MADGAKANFDQFLARHEGRGLAPPEPARPEAAPDQTAEPRWQDATDLGPVEETITYWLPTEGRFVNWREWRTKTPFSVEETAPDPIPPAASIIEAAFKDHVRVQLREDGGRWERWLFDHAHRRWVRQPATASPSSGHGREWTEMIYGPPTGQWRVAERREIPPPQPEPEPEI